MLPYREYYRIGIIIIYNILSILKNICTRFQFVSNEHNYQFDYDNINIK